MWYTLNTMQFNYIPDNIFFILLKFDFAAAYPILEIFFSQFKPSIYHLVRGLISDKYSRDTPFIRTLIKRSELQYYFIFFWGKPAIWFFNSFPKNDFFLMIRLRIQIFQTLWLFLLVYIRLLWIMIWVFTLCNFILQLS